MSALSDLVKVNTATKPQSGSALATLAVPQKPKITSKNLIPAGGVRINLPSGNEAFKTPSGSIWEYLPDGTRQITLSSQFGGGAYNINSSDPSKTGKTPKQLQAERDYAGISSAPGMNRDHVVPVSLGGSNTQKQNINLVPKNQNPKEFEAEIARKVQSGEMSLAQGRLAILTFKNPSPKPGLFSSLTQTVKNALGFSEDSYATNPVYGIYKGLKQPSEGSRQVEQAGEVEKLPPIAKQIAQGAIRLTVPGIEEFAKQAGTAIGTKGRELPSSMDAFIAGGNLGLTFASVGGIKAVTDVIGRFGDELVNKSTTVRITPEQLRVKLANGEIKTPQGQRLARELIAKGQSLEATGTEARGGAAEKLGKAIGGQENPANLQIKTISEGQPGELPNLKNLALNPSAKGYPSVDAPTPLNPAKTYPRLIPIKETALQTPEIKTSKLAQGVATKAIENKLSTGFQGLPEYAKVNIKDQAKVASNLLNTDTDKAISIAMGHELPPEGVLPESVFVAVENYAIETKDVALLKDLATSSSLTSEATGMGQRIRMLAERNPDSAVAAIQKVVKNREAAATKRFGDIKKAKAQIKNEIQTEIIAAAPKAKDWTSFLDELKCK